MLGGCRMGDGRGTSSNLLLGSLFCPSQVHVQQLPSASDGGGVGWYLDRIEVAGPEGEHWDFPCSAWLGKSNSPSGLDGAWAGRGAGWPAGTGAGAASPAVPPAGWRQPAAAPCPARVCAWSGAPSCPWRRSPPCRQPRAPPGAVCRSVAPPPPLPHRWPSQPALATQARGSPTNSRWLAAAARGSCVCRRPRAQPGAGGDALQPAQHAGAFVQLVRGAAAPRGESWGTAVLVRRPAAYKTRAMQCSAVPAGCAACQGARLPRKQTRAPPSRPPVLTHAPPPLPPPRALPRAPPSRYAGVGGGAAPPREGCQGGEGAQPAGVWLRRGGRLLQLLQPVGVLQR